MRFRTKVWLLATVVGVTLVGVGLVAGGSRQESRPAGAAATATASHLAPELVPTAKARLMATVEADRAKPQYIGVLGNFLIVSTEEEWRSNAPCPVVSGRGPDGDRDFLPSELNLPVMREQAVCADGTVVNVYAEMGSRFYFTDRPKVRANAPLDRLELVEVDGHPALVVEPAAGLGPHTVWVIQRSSTNERPGVLGVTSSREGLEAAIERARQLLITPLAGGGKPEDCPPDWWFFDTAQLRYTICFPPDWGIHEGTTIGPLDATLLPPAELRGVAVWSREWFPYPVGAAANPPPDVAARMRRASRIALGVAEPELTFGGGGCTPSKPVVVGGLSGVYRENIYDIMPAGEAVYTPTGELHATKILLPLFNVVSDVGQNTSGYRLYVKVVTPRVLLAEREALISQILNTMRVYR